MSVTPDFIGQIYKDTATGNLWRANSLAAGDWTLELQNMQVKWSPTNVNWHENGGFQQDAGLDGMTSLTLEFESLAGPLQMIAPLNIVTISVPNLTEINDLNLGYVEITDCADLTSVSLPSLSFVRFGVTINFSPLLTTINLSSWLPTNGGFHSFNENALTAATVNHLLARGVANPAFVTGTLTTAGGTSAAPTGQGIADKATLIGRGVTVSTN